MATFSRQHRQDRAVALQLKKGREHDQEQRSSTPSLWREVHQRLGNQEASRLFETGPASAYEHYLLHLLEASRATEESLLEYLPWRASQQWLSLVHSWYQEIWSRGGRANPALNSASLDFESTDVDTLAPSVPSLGATETSSSGQGAPLPESPVSAGEPVVLRLAQDPAGEQDLELGAWQRRLESNTGTGRELSDIERAFLERVHRQPIPALRIHEGPQAARASAEIQARAFAVDNEIWLGEPVDLSTERGAALLAHESTHVIQAAAGRQDQGGAQISQPGEPLELEADARGREAARLVQAPGPSMQEDLSSTLDPAGRFLVAWIASRLPVESAEITDSMLWDRLKNLLSGRAHARLVQAETELGILEQERGDVGSWRELLGRAREQIRLLCASVNGDPRSEAALRALIEVAGAPTSKELRQSGAILEDRADLFPRLERALASLAGPDPLRAALAPAEPASSEGPEHVLDPDVGRARETAQLVSQWTRELGISRVEVRADSESGARLESMGVEALAQGQEIFLDPTSFDPGSAHGRQVLGHELAHVAQASLEPSSNAADGRLAEAEAHQVGSALARGVAAPEPGVGLPGSHVAAFEDVGGVSELLATLDTNRSGVESSTSGLEAPEGYTSEVGEAATEDHESKVEQYEDGVDGIADMIGDLDAFEDLIDAIDEEEDRQGPMSRVRGSDPYDDLKRMWQGAIEGGEDSGEMRSIFNSEFEDRGFWAETEQAYDMVRDSAKREARPDSQAAGAHATVEEAQTGLEEAIDESGLEDEGAGESAEGGGLAQDISAAQAQLQAFMGASVEPTAPAIGLFDQLSEVNDEQLGAISEQLDHQSGFSAGAGEWIATDRTGQILETLVENAAGSFIQGFIDQGIDSLIMDNAGFLGDQVLKLATRGRLGTPMIGPLIGLAQNPPWTAGAWGGEAFGRLDDTFGRMGETWSGWQHCQDPTDYLGVGLALVGDVLAVLRDFLDGLATIAGTLSALCYVVGGILILVGLALVWLAGIGAPLITAGGWLTRAGGILSRVNTALGIIVLVLSGLVTVFRTAAAFLVPAELYAGQLQDLGQSAGIFGEKSGAKVADNLAGDVNERIREPVQNRVNARLPGQDSTGFGAGQSEAARQRQMDEAAQQQLESTERQLQDRQQNPEGEQTPRPQDGEETPRPQDQEQTPRPQDGEETPRPQDDAPAPPRTRMRRIIDALGPVGRQIDELTTCARDFGEMVRQGQRSAIEGLPPVLRQDLVDHMDRSLQQAQQKAQDLQTRLQEYQQEGRPDADISSVQRQIDAQNQKVNQIRDDLDQTRRTIDEIVRAERNAQRGMDEEEDQRTLDDIRRRLEEKQQEIDQAQERLRQAQEQDQEAQERARADQEALDGSNESIRQRREQQNQSHQDELTRLRSEADDLRRQASDAEESRTLRSEAERLAQESQSAQQQSETVMQAMQQRVGERVSLVDPTGQNQNGMTQRRIISVDENGVTVSKGRNGTETFGFDQIRYPAGLRDDAQRFQELREQATTADEQSRTQRQQADGLAPDGTDPNALRQQADALQEQAAQREHEHANRPEEPPSAGHLELQGASETSRGRADESSSSVRQAQESVDRLNREAQELRGREQAIADDMQVPEGEQDRADAMSRHHGSVIAPTSGNATGGVGSSYKGLGEWALRQIGLVDALSGLLSSNSLDSQWYQQNSRSEEGEDQRTVGMTGQMLAFDGAHALLGGLGYDGQRETGEQLKTEGEEQAARELERMRQRQETIRAMVSLEPPFETTQILNDARAAAIESYDRYIRAHAEALRAFEAEQVVDQLSQQTLALAAEGEPVCAAAQSVQGPIQQSISDEQSREQVLSGANTNVQESEGGLTGLVTELIMKMADNSDSMDDQPQPGDGDSGGQMQNGQSLARDEATQRTDQGAEASEQQRSFLDQALDARAAQEESVATNIQNLEGKYQEEQGILQEIKTQKAQHLVERESARSEVEQHSGTFVDAFQSMESWRQEYVARRQAVEGL